MCGGSSRADLVVLAMCRRRSVDGLHRYRCFKERRSGPSRCRGLQTEIAGKAAFVVSSQTRSCYCFCSSTTSNTAWSTEAPPTKDVYSARPAGTTVSSHGKINNRAQRSPSGHHGTSYASVHIPSSVLTSSRRSSISNPSFSSSSCSCVRAHTSGVSRQGLSTVIEKGESWNRADTCIFLFRLGDSRLWAIHHSTTRLSHIARGARILLSNLAGIPAVPTIMLQVASANGQFPRPVLQVRADRRTSIALRLISVHHHGHHHAHMRTLRFVPEQPVQQYTSRLDSTTRMRMYYSTRRLPLVSPPITTKPCVRPIPPVAAASTNRSAPQDSTTPSAYPPSRSSCPPCPIAPSC